jgi:cell division protein ZapE
VSDVADAMILYRLLDALFKNKVQFIMTSNYRPDLLYPDGLHRDRVLPAINDEKKNSTSLMLMPVWTIVRSSWIKCVRISCHCTPEVTDELNSVFAQLGGAHAEEPKELFIENRVIHSHRRAGGIAWFSFNELCAGPRSQNDYLELLPLFIR